MSPPSALWRSGRALSGWDQGCAADMVRVCAAALSLSSPQPFETCCWQQVKEEGELPPAWIEPAEDLSPRVLSSSVTAGPPRLSQDLSALPCFLKLFPELLGRAELCHWLQMLLHGTGQSSRPLRCLPLALSLADAEGCWLLGTWAATCVQA